ncbi:single-stranded DNA-binding protein [bacterium]|nr:single-stranded DNA-binding protein [bacterium]
MSLVSISIVGNIVRDPESRQFDSGRRKTSLHVAVNDYNRTTREKSAEFYKIEAWDRLSDLAGKYLRKGNQITVSGRLSLERWVDRSGKDRCTPVIHANQLSLPPRTGVPQNENQNQIDLQRGSGEGEENEPEDLEKENEKEKQLLEQFSGVFT